MNRFLHQLVLLLAVGLIFALHHAEVLAAPTVILSFGSNADGRTGLGTTSGDTLVATPIDTTNLGGRAIRQVAAGGAHSLVLAEDGTVFAFGDNGLGRTGLGTDVGSMLVATPIDTSNLGNLAVTQVAAGGSHSLLIAVPEPGSLTLTGLALLALLSLARRQQLA